MKSLKDKVKYRIKRSRDNVFLLKDFDDLANGDRDQIGRALGALKRDGVIIRISKGMYAELGYSETLNKTLPKKPLPTLTREGLEKLGYKVVPTYYEKLYNEGKSTQVPSGSVIGVKERVNRRFEYDGWEIDLERVTDS